MRTTTPNRGSLSRRELQRRLRAAIIAELNNVSMPQDGRHLGRLVRALMHLAIELMQTVGVPDAVTAQVISRVARKTLKSAALVEPIVGVFGPVRGGKA